jgi:hypothetical protein
LRRCLLCQRSTKNEFSAGEIGDDVSALGSCKDRFMAFNRLWFRLQLRRSTVQKKGAPPRTAFALYAISCKANKGSRLTACGVHQIQGRPISQNTLEVVVNYMPVLQLRSQLAVSVHDGLRYSSTVKFYSRFKSASDLKAEALLYCRDLSTHLV